MFSKLSLKIHLYPRKKLMAFKQAGTFRSFVNPETFWAHLLWLEAKETLRGQAQCCDVCHTRGTPSVDLWISEYDLFWKKICQIFTEFTHVLFIIFSFIKVLLLFKNDFFWREISTAVMDPWKKLFFLPIVSSSCLDSMFCINVWNSTCLTFQLFLLLKVKAHVQIFSSHIKTRFVDVLLKPKVNKHRLFHVISPEVSRESSSCLSSLS